MPSRINYEPESLNKQDNNDLAQSANQSVSISFKDIECTYATRTVLQIPELTINHGITVLLGANGSGKSSLIKLAAGQSKPSRGNVFVNRKPLNTVNGRQLARWVGYLPQHLPVVPGLHVNEFVRMGRYPWRGAFGRYTNTDDVMVKQAITECNLRSLSDSRMSTLSGGEQQRAWFAMLLAQQSPLWLLDEPLSALDVEHQIACMQLVKNHASDPQHGALLILHDINHAAIADRVIVLHAGSIAFDGTAEQLLQKDTLKNLFGVTFQMIFTDDNSLPVAVPQWHTD
ncbi:MAG: ABC transporter ATP-binding protein [Pseudomonadota bacterium]